MSSISIGEADAPERLGADLRLCDEFHHESLRLMHKDQSRLKDVVYEAR